jgi:hypothetical protein
VLLGAAWCDFSLQYKKRIDKMIVRNSRSIEQKLYFGFFSIKIAAEFLEKLEKSLVFYKLNYL